MFLCIYIILKWILVWFWKKSGLFRSVEMQNLYFCFSTTQAFLFVLFCFFSLWQTITVVDGHSTNANKQTAKSVTINHTHKINQHKCDHWLQKAGVWSLSQEMLKPLALIKSEWSNDIDFFFFYLVLWLLLVKCVPVER